MARAILDKAVGQEQFTPEKVGETALKALIEKVKPDYQNHFSTAVEVEMKMKDGKTVSSQLETARGMPGSPLGWEELEGKFRECAGAVLSDRAVAATIERLKNFEKMDDVAEFVAPFTITST